MLEHSGFGGHTECSRVFQNGFALEHDGGRDGRIGQVHLEAGAQHVFAIAI